MAVDVTQQILHPPLTRGEAARVVVTATLTSDPSGWATRFSFLRDPGDTPIAVNLGPPAVTGVAPSVTATWTVLVPASASAAARLGLNTWELAKVDAGCQVVLARGTWLVLDAVTAFATADSAELAPPPPLALYPFDGTADDASGNGRHLTPSGAAYAAGKFGQALSAGDAARTPLGGISGITSPCSLSVWVQPPPGSAGVNSTYRNWGFLVPYTLTLRVFMGSNPDMSDTNVVGLVRGNVRFVYGGLLVSDAWNHLALTWDGAAAVLWVNGVARSYNTGSEGTTDGFATEPFGTNLTGGTGVIQTDDLAVAPVALTPGQIAWLWNAGVGRTYPY